MEKIKEWKELIEYPPPLTWSILTSHWHYQVMWGMPTYLKVEYLIICIICDTDLVNKLILQVYTLHKYK